MIRLNYAQHPYKRNNKFDTMKKFTEILKTLDSNELNKEQLLSILDICSNKIDILTISKMARKENKTPTGIRTSNQYRKIKIGGQLMAVKGIKESYLPFN